MRGGEENKVRISRSRERERGERVGEERRAGSDARAPPRESWLDSAQLGSAGSVQFSFRFVSRRSDESSRVKSLSHCCAGEGGGARGRIRR